MSSFPRGPSWRRTVWLINLLDWNSQDVWKPRSILPLIPLMKRHQNRRGWGRRCKLCFQLQEYSIPQTAPCTLHLSVPCAWISTLVPLVRIRLSEQQNFAVLIPRVELVNEAATVMRGLLCSLYHCESFCTQYSSLHRLDLMLSFSAFTSYMNWPHVVSWNGPF